jgi:hypothetical protein
MCVPNLRYQREQHAKQHNPDICFRETLVPWVGVHVAGHYHVVVRLRRGRFGHGVHRYVPSGVSQSYLTRC